MGRQIDIPLRTLLSQLKEWSRCESAADEGSCSVCRVREECREVEFWLDQDGDFPETAGYEEITQLEGEQP